MRVKEVLVWWEKGRMREKWMEGLVVACVCIYIVVL